MKRTSSRPSNHTHLFNIIRQHGLDTVPRIKLLMSWVEIDPKDQTIINELKETLYEEIQLQRLSPDPFRKTATCDGSILDGGIKLGVMPHHGFPYAIEPAHLIWHLLVMGKTGGGKTTVIKNLLMQILQSQNCPNMMILERKQEFAELAAAYPDFNVLDVEHLSFNPLLPPSGIKTEIWIGIFTECMINYLDILEASSSFLTDHALKLIELKKQTGEYPNLADLFSFIAGIKYAPMTKNGQQKQTVMNRLTNLRHNLPGMFDPKGHISIDKLMNSHCLVLLHDIPHIGIQNFAISLLLAQIFLYRKTKAGLQNELTNLVVVDEAASLFRRQDELRKEHSSFVSEVIRTARGYGIGMIAASQQSTDLSHSLLANVSTRMMVGGFGRTADIDAFLKLRGYTPEQRDYVIKHPNIGKAFIADGRWPHIVECNMDNPRLPLRLTPVELQARISESFNRMATPPPKPTVATTSPLKPAADTKPPEPHPDTIPLGIQVLNSVYENHFIKMNERRKELNVPRATLEKKIKALESMGLLRIYKVHGRSGPPRDLYEITPDGCAMINKPEKKTKGKGSYLHRFYQQNITRHFKSEGYRVEIEGTACGKNIDLIVRKQPSGECVAIEIELNSEANPDHVMENLEKAARVDFIDRILCLVPKQPECKAIQKSVTKSGLLKTKPIQVERLCTYLEN